MKGTVMDTVTEGFMLKHKVMKVVVLSVIGILVDELYDKKILGPAITRYSRKNFTVVPPQEGIHGV